VENVEFFLVQIYLLDLIFCRTIMLVDKPLMSGSLNVKSTIALVSLDMH